MARNVSNKQLRSSYVDLRGVRNREAQVIQMLIQSAGKSEGGGMGPETEEYLRTLIDLFIKNQEIRDKVRRDETLQDREEWFEHEFKRLSKPECAYGICIMAVPVGDDLRIKRICRSWNSLVKEIVLPRFTVKRQIPAKCQNLRPNFYGYS